MIVEDQREVIGFLSDPRAFGPGVRRVERIDTHSAAVFLAGDRAYKLKRAVRYDYLDFSTLEKRRSSCEAEVALNRRAAPNLYLGVLAVTRESDGRLALRGSGSPVDWLVHMVRFDETALLDRLASRGALDVGSMPELAAAVFRLHQAAERRTDHGGRAGLAWVIEGNAAGLVEQGRGVFDLSASERVIARARAALERCSGLLEVRRQQGFVRRCHGDLHLRNIVLIDGHPTLFDAVEFNDRIACVDVLYDLAFLLMDLWRLDLRSHANELFNRYMTATGQHAALSLLPLFLSCRSAVRAKTSATARGMQADAARAAELAANARAYLARAEELLQPPPARLIAVGGRSGSGKSTLARHLAPGIGAAPGALVLRSDVVRKALFGVTPGTRLAAQAYTSEITGRVYRELAECAALALRAGHAVVVDAAFGGFERRASAAAVAREAGVPFTGLWLEAPAGVLADRIRERRADPSDATLEVLKEQLSQDAGSIDWARIDASADPDTVRRRAEAVIRS